MMKQILFLGVLLLVSCGDSSRTLSLGSFSPDSQIDLTPEEKKALLPNKLFEAIFNRVEDQDLEKIITDNRDYLFAVNEEGDTPVGFGIKYNNKEGSRFLLSHLRLEDMYHQNYAGESYIYLLAKKGYVDLMEMISDSLFRFSIDYEFKNVDLETNNKERALHVAKDATVAKFLKEEYGRGLFDVSGMNFSWQVNTKGQNFMHTAVINERASVLNWGVNWKCSKPKAKVVEEGEEGWISWTVDLVVDTARGIGGLVRDGNRFFNLNSYYVINQQDEDGNTPLHQAAKQLSLKGLEILMSCPLASYLLENNEGDIPLQTFIKSLDLGVASQDQDLENLFRKLSDKTTPYSVNKTISYHVNHANQDGDTSLHLAARLTDPFFYQYLRKYGNEFETNNKGETPDSIFKKTQSEKDDQIL